MWNWMIVSFRNDNIWCQKWELVTLVQVFTDSVGTSYRSLENLAYISEKSVPYLFLRLPVFVSVTVFTDHCCHSHRSDFESAGFFQTREIICLFIVSLVFITISSWLFLCCIDDIVEDFGVGLVVFWIFGINLYQRICFGAAMVSPQPLSWKLHVKGFLACFLVVFWFWDSEIC